LRADVADGSKPVNLKQANVFLVPPKADFPILELTPAAKLKLAVILHRMWMDRTEFNWSKKEVAA
jgi:hypothetical protein